jgi:large conductance mechanosensitive channel
MFREFVEFLKEYGVVGLALAVVIGGKLNALVTAVVDGLIMPLVTPILPAGDWRTAAWVAGPFRFLPGPVIAGLVDFAIVAFVVFLLARKLLREEKVAKM